MIWPAKDSMGKLIPSRGLFISLKQSVGMPVTNTGLTNTSFRTSPIPRRTRIATRGSQAPRSIQHATLPRVYGGFQSLGSPSALSISGDVARISTVKMLKLND